MKPLTFLQILAALARAFNRLMGLDGTEFAGSGRAREPSLANLRAAAKGRVI